MQAQGLQAEGQQAAQAPVSNLLYFLQMLEFFYNQFESQIGDQRQGEKSHEARTKKFIDHFNPLYLPKYSLFGEQTKAELPEIFVLQSLITLDCLLNPIKDQINVFKIDEQEQRYLQHMRERGEALLKDTMR